MPGKKRKARESGIAEKKGKAAIGTGPNSKKLSIRSRAAHVWQQMMNKPSGLFFTILFDALFFLSIVVLSALMKEQLSGYPGITPSRVMYIALVLAAYTFFKFFILEICKEYFQEKRQAGLLSKVDVSRMLPFFFMNFIIFSSLVIVDLLISLVVGWIFRLLSLALPINVEIIIVALVGFGITAVLFYPLIGISHSLFSHGEEVLKSFWISIKITFTRIKHYGFTYLLLLSTVIGLGLLYMLIDVIIGAAFREEAILTFYARLATVLAYASLIIIYLVHVYNRAYFMHVAQSHRQASFFRPPAG